jgi:hypothetical protein
MQPKLQKTAKKPKNKKIYLNNKNQSKNKLKQQNITKN